MLDIYRGFYETYFYNTFSNSYLKRLWGKNQSKQYKNREEKEINTEILLGSITGLCPHRVSGYKSFI